MSIPLGSTRRLTTTFHVGTVLTDPTAVSLTVRKPDGTDATYTYALSQVTKGSTGVYYKDVLLDTAGVWKWRWTGTGAAAGVDEGTFRVQASLFDALMLCTVDDVKDQIESSNTEDDDLIQRLIINATAYVMSYTGRQFLPAEAAATTRTFEAWPAYDVLIDDLIAAPTAVSILDANGTSLGMSIDVATEVTLHPRYRAPGHPITMLTLDTTIGNWALGRVVSVTGRWGWPAVPADVEHACVLIVREWLTKSDAEWGMPAGLSTGDQTFSGPIRFALPYAAKQILDRYRRVTLA